MPMDYVKPGEELRASRVAVIIVPSPVAEQWERAIRANRPVGHVFLVVDTRNDDPDISKLKLPAVLRRLEGTNEPSIVLVVVRSTGPFHERSQNKYLNQIGDMSHMALAALVVDEAPLVASLVAGRNAANLRWPPVFRTLLLTAQPIKLMTGSKLANSSATALKALIYDDPSIGTMTGPKMMPRRRDAFVRFSLADPAVCIQRELSATAGARMPTVINLYNVWLPSTSLRELAPSMCSWFRPNIPLHFLSPDSGINSWTQGILNMLNFTSGLTRQRDVERKRTMPMADVAALVEGTQNKLETVAAMEQTIHSKEYILVRLEEAKALSTRLQQPVWCAICPPAAARAATCVSTCCGNLLCDEHAIIASSNPPESDGDASEEDSDAEVDDANCYCPACSPDFATPDLEALYSARCVGVKAALAHAVKHFIDEGHTRIMLLFSHDAASLVKRRFMRDTLLVDATNIISRAAPGATCVDGSRTDALAAFNGAQGVSIIMLTDIAFDDSMAMTGVDLPHCDAVVALGRMQNEAQAFSRALRLSPNPRPELPVVRILWKGCDVGPEPVPLEVAPVPPPPLPSTATFVRDVLQATLRLDEDADMEEWGYNHLALRSVSFTFRGEGFERLVISAPPVVAVDGDRMGQLTFAFAHCVFSECVPDQTRGITLRHEGGGLRFSWVSGTNPPVPLRAVAHCLALDIDVVTREGVSLQASATAEPVEEQPEEAAGGGGSSRTRGSKRRRS